MSAANLTPANVKLVLVISTLHLLQPFFVFLSYSIDTNVHFDCFPWSTNLVLKTKRHPRRGQVNTSDLRWPIPIPSPPSKENLLWNKKVLLRERKRHTAHRVANARPTTVRRGGGGYPIMFSVVPAFLGYPASQVLLWPGPRFFPGGTPVLSWLGGRGIPSRPGQGVLQSCPDWGRGGYTILTWPGLGYPCPPPSQDWGTPGKNLGPVT